MVSSRSVVLKLLRPGVSFPTRRFAGAADRARLSPQDRAFAQELLYGVIRKSRTLDALYRPLLKHEKMSPSVRWVLRMGTYQLCFMDRVPDHAAVNETLSVAGPVIGGGRRFVNAVLRNLQRQRGADPQKYDQDAFQSSAQDELDQLAIEHSFPTELVEDWFEDVGKEKALGRMTAFNQRPSMALRVNPLKADRDSVLQALQEAEIAAEAGKAEQSILLLDGSRNPTTLPGFPEGHFSVQDQTSQESLALAAPKKGEKVLDLCAAPGGKAFAAFESMGGEGTVLACDVAAERLEKMKPEIERLGHQGIQTGTVAPDGANLPQEEWDLIVLDVPCSNTGVLGKRPEARWRFSDDELGRVLSTQALISKTAARIAVPNTRILWSTCSLEGEENHEGAEALAAATGRTIAEAQLFEPDQSRSGGYAALLVP
ncbi:MAG: class I SAM-dependent methyltransferase [Planctomycetes bacterium]|nr:class I SAM-dependent methyltransferase [Planctomycetota bacterium]